MTYEWHTDNMRFERKIKNSLHAMPVLGYLPKLERSLELAFGVHFLHGFLMQMLLISYSIN